MRHSTNLALQVVPASAPPRRGAEMSALLCRLALGQQATSVARRLGRSEDLVRGWARGDSSPSLAQILDAPPAFASRLLATAGKLYTAPAVRLPIRDRLWLCGVALGSCPPTPGRETSPDTSPFSSEKDTSEEAEEGPQAHRGQGADRLSELIAAAIAEARSLGLVQVEIRLRNALTASSKRRAS